MPAIPPGRWRGRTWVTDGPIDNAEPYLRCLADPRLRLWPVVVFPDERCNAADWLDREPAFPVTVTEAGERDAGGGHGGWWARECCAPGNPDHCGGTRLALVPTDRSADVPAALG